MLRSEEKCIASVRKQAFRQVLNVREVTITCLGFINPKHVAKPMKENISCVSTDFVSFFVC
jgi:cysteine sulfinate desulfinase/cysteine desulfurase-like protein